MLFQDVLGSQLCFEDIKVGIKIMSVNFLPNKYLQQMLDNVGINLPNYKLRNLTEDLTTTSNGAFQSNGLTKPEFESLCHKLTQEDVRRTFKTSKQHDRLVVLVLDRILIVSNTVYQIYSVDKK